MEEKVWAKCGNVRQCSLAQDGDLVVVSDVSQFKCHARLHGVGSCGVSFQDVDGAPIAAIVKNIDEPDSSDDRKVRAKWAAMLERREIRLVGIVIFLMLVAFVVSRFQNHPSTNEQAVHPCEKASEASAAQVAVGVSLGQLRESVDLFVTCGKAPLVVAALRTEVEKGNGIASMVLADTYNPLLRAIPDSSELPASIESAYTYYRLALEYGEEEAACRLERLKSRVADLAVAGDAAAVRQLSVWPDTLRGC